MTNKNTTTEIEFALEDDFDTELADEGVWQPYSDEYDDYLGEFKLAHFDGDSRRVKLARNRIRDQYQKEIRLKTFDDDQFVREVFLSCVLLGWKDVKSADGKDVPFNEANARAYFSKRKPKKAINKLLEQAADERNYFAPKDEVAGN